MDLGSFCGGSLIGALYGAVIVYVNWQLAETRKKIAAADNPFNKFPDAVQPTLTASGVTRTSRIARLTYAVLVVFLAVFILSYPIVIYLLLA